MEVLRLLRSGICEMDVRAGWARMAKRPRRGCKWSSFCLCGCMGKDQDQELQPHLLLSKSGGLHRDPYPLLFLPAEYWPGIWVLTFEKVSGDLFREHVASRRNCGDEAGSQISASMFGAWGSGDSLISKLGEL